MKGLLARIGGSATRVLFAGIFVGLLIPQLAAFCRPLLAPTVLAILLAMLLRVDWPSMFGYLRRPILLGLLATGLLLAAPLLVWQVLSPFGLPAALFASLVLMAAAPPILSATSLTAFLGLESALAIVVAVACVLLAPLSLPPLALALIGIELDVSVAELMLRLGLIVAGAFLGAALIRRLAGPERLRAQGQSIDGTIVVLMLIFAIAVMDGVTTALLARPGTVLLWLAAAFAANLLLQLAGGLAFAWLGARHAMTAGLLFGNRNMGLLLAALPLGTDPDIHLFLAVGQIPIYTLPALLLPLYRRLQVGRRGHRKPSH